MAIHDAIIRLIGLQSIVITFTDGDGEEITALTSDDVNVSLIHPDKEEAMSLTMIVAVYTPEGKLAYVKQAVANENGAFSANLALTENSDGIFADEGYTAAVFLWNDATIPVMEKYVFPALVE